MNRLSNPKFGWVASVRDMWRGPIGGQRPLRASGGACASRWIVQSDRWSEHPGTAKVVDGRDS
eukprot:151008-Pyramimonas_sp.AAC.1